jgi:hypothetical protein
MLLLILLLMRPSIVRRPLFVTRKFPKVTLRLRGLFLLIHVIEHPHVDFATAFLEGISLPQIERYGPGRRAQRRCGQSGLKNMILIGYYNFSRSALEHWRALCQAPCAEGNA